MGGETYDLIELRLILMELRSGRSPSGGLNLGLLNSHPGCMAPRQGKVSAKLF